MMIDSNELLSELHTALDEAGKARHTHENVTGINFAIGWVRSWLRQLEKERERITEFTSPER